MEKINIAEILKNCPSGMELDCTLFEGLEFDNIVDNEFLPIRCRIKNSKGGYNVHYFTEYGQWDSLPYAKCVIFPKGKTTWEGFQRPFKDGDVVVAEDDESFQLFLLKHLTHSEDDNNYDGYCYFGWDFQCNELFEKGNWGFNRHATEEEKQRFFNAIKANGYKWNAETKTLDKLVQPKFKVGDRIIKRDSIENWIVSSVSSEYYGLQLPKGSEGIGVLPVVEQDDWELISDIEPKFKVGDRIVHKVNKESPFTITEITDTSYKGGYRYEVLIEQQDNFELVPNKFDITTLVPFESKVLMRSSNAREWVGTIYSHYNNNYFFGCGMMCQQCIPYEGNEHLIGKTDDCNDFYKTW